MDKQEELQHLDAALTALSEAQKQLRPLAERSANIQFALQDIRRADDTVAELYHAARILSEAA